MKKLGERQSQCDSANSNPKEDTEDGNALEGTQSFESENKKATELATQLETENTPVGNENIQDTILLTSVEHENNQVDILSTSDEIVISMPDDGTEETSIARDTLTVEKADTNYDIGVQISEEKTSVNDFHVVEKINNHGYDLLTPNLDLIAVNLNDKDECERNNIEAIRVLEPSKDQNALEGTQLFESENNQATKVSSLLENERNQDTVLSNTVGNNQVTILLNPVEKENNLVLPMPTSNEVVLNMSEDGTEQTNVARDTLTVEKEDTHYHIDINILEEKTSVNDTHVVETIKIQGHDLLTPNLDLIAANNNDKEARERTKNEAIRVLEPVIVRDVSNFEDNVRNLSSPLDEAYPGNQMVEMANLDTNSV